jgi:poly(hydroxyalkanoate) depolymerase family esterase
MKINEEFLAQMRAAAQLLQTEGPMAASAAVQRALQGASAGPQQAQPGQRNDDSAQPSQAWHAGPVQDLVGKWKDMFARQPFEDVDFIDMPGANSRAASEVIEEATPDAGNKGRFIAGACTNAAGTRAWKLYIPSGYRDERDVPRPLVVMLHGCTQNPDDFAAGTRMNAIAEEHNCFVVYPAQSQNANGQHCWNWFQTGDQQRDKGEPSIIADITRDIAGKYRIDTGRIYVAGMSAGGAMAMVLAATYPELYAAVGVHSGLPYGVAHDMPSAFAAMSRGKAKIKSGQGPLMHVKEPEPLRKAVPVIVFHGDRDGTVAPLNGDQALEQCVPGARDKAKVDVERGSTPGGRTYTRTVVRGAQGRAIAEKWTIHGAGHAWSGGSGAGSYTDPTGPDASREMLRFFLEQR